MRASIATLCNKTAWAKTAQGEDLWIPLRNCWLGTTLTTEPGLYRIRLVEEEWTPLAYIGQGKNLKERVGALKHIYKDVSPQHDPHFAAPSLWQWLQHYPQAQYEVSVAPFPGVPKPLRLGLECLAILLQHTESHRSPLVNFGRTAAEWQAAWSLSLDGQEEQLGPLAHLDSLPYAQEWCGLAWTPWMPLKEAQLPQKDQTGLYRLRVFGCDSLLFVGQGKLAGRLRPYRTFPTLECSWAESDWGYHRRLELVSDLVGAHLLTTATVPLWQFQKDVPVGGPEENQMAA